MRLERNVLEHIGRHRRAVRRSIERVSGLADCSNVLAALKKKGLIRTHPTKDGVSTYGLSDRGTKELGLPPKRAGRLGEASLSGSLGALWFCAFSGHRRVRLEYAEAERLLGEAPPKGLVLCLEEEPEPCLYRMYASGGLTSDRDIVRAIRKAKEATQRNVRLRSWMESRQYGIATLVPERGRVERVRKLVADELGKDLKVTVEYAPDLAGLASALRGLAP